MNPYTEQARANERADFPHTNRVDSLLCRGKKNHDFTLQEPDIDFCFEPFSQNTQGYLTGQGSDVKLGDFITLKVDSLSQKYVIEEMDFYSSPDDMWVARVVRVKP